MNIEAFKHKLNRVFDDTLHTKQWENVVDYTIIALIVLSTLQIFLSTYESIESRFGMWLKIIDYVTIAAFTVEVTLRIWCADLIDDKYKGLMGRVRYCLSFYGLIDFLSTYSFYIALFFPIPYNVLKVLRVARLLRLFRYMKAFKILNDAFTSKKEEMLVSLQFLSIVTLMLSFILFFVEHEVQPDVYQNGWNSVVWAFAQYIGDPGHFAETPPITFTGRIIACIIGVLGIAIFAVPAGLIASGFSDSMAQMQKEEEEDKYRMYLRRAFKSSLSKNLRDYLVNRNKQITDEGAKTMRTSFMTHDMERELNGLRYKRNIPEDIAVNIAMRFPEFRLTKNNSDQLTIEHFPVNRPYGCCIDRGSKVTIVSPTTTEFGMSYITYYLAKFGGFNYVSKEVVADYNNITSYYNIHRDGYVNAEGLDDVEGQKGLARERSNINAYLDDIKRVATANDHWVIYFLSCPNRDDKTYKADIWLANKTAKGIDCVLNNEAYNAFAESLTSAMQEFDFVVADGNTRHVLVDGQEKVNCGKLLQDQGAEFNTFTIRMCKNFRFSGQKFVHVYRMAEVINSTINPGGHITDIDFQEMSKARYGYLEQDADNL